MTPTAFCLDPDHVAHDRSGHPETAGRLLAVERRLPARSETSGFVRLACPEAEWTDLKLVHTPAYLEHLRSLDVTYPILLDSDTYFTPASLNVARRGVGGALTCLQAVLEGRAMNAFAIQRPPGHHATPDRAMGFCLLNAVAVAAQVARHRFGLQRVAIVDFDVHHGNGTQDAFYNDGEVLFASVHQSPLYPGTGAIGERGSGGGEGATINLPVPDRCGDEIYEALFDRILGPELERFEPELIVVSAGFDAHWRDPLASTQLSVTGFAALVRRLSNWAAALCDGNLLLVLEGGYDRPALTACVDAVLDVLRDPDAAIEDPFGPPPSPGRLPDTVVPTLVEAFR